MPNNMGFLQSEDESKKLNYFEKKIGLKFLEKEHEPFPGEIGEYRTVHLRTTDLYGCYRGITEKGFGVLLPHIVYVVDNPFEQNRKKRVFRARWEIKVPKYFHFGEVIGLDVLEEDYARKITGEGFPSDID